MSRLICSLLSFVSAIRASNFLRSFMLSLAPAKPPARAPTNVPIKEPTPGKIAVPIKNPAVAPPLLPKIPPPALIPFSFNLYLNSSFVILPFFNRLWFAIVCATKTILAKPQANGLITAPPATASPSAKAAPSTATIVPIVATDLPVIASSLVASTPPLNTLVSTIKRASSSVLPSAMAR